MLFTNYATSNAKYNENSFENGNALNGHSTCLYEPFDRHTKFISREFQTTHSSSLPVVITVNVQKNLLNFSNFQKISKNLRNL